MKTNIFFVRHAHSYYSKDEYERPISDIGKEKLDKVTSILLNYQVDIFISSPYKRAIQTIEKLANILNKNIEIIDGLKERCIGDIQNIGFHEAVLKLWNNSSFSFPNGESNDMAQERGIIVINSILSRYRGKNIVIGTHGNIMVLIMNKLNKKYGYDFWKHLDMPDIYQLSFNDDELIDIKRIWDK